MTTLYLYLALPHGTPNEKATRLVLKILQETPNEKAARLVLKILQRIHVPLSIPYGLGCHFNVWLTAYPREAQSIPLAVNEEK
nr:hypothetical protein [Tanacetum cinerariifolium]